MLNQEIKPTELFRSKKIGDKYKLYDKLFNHPIIDEAYDKISFTNDYILLYFKDRITVLDRFAVNIQLDSVLAAFGHFNNLQFIKNGKISWLDKEGNIHDTLPQMIIGVCGNYWEINRKIQLSEKGFIESIDNKNWVKNRIRDSVLILGKDKAKDLNYLTNLKVDDYYEYSKLTILFSFPYNYYITDLGTKKRIISVTNNRDRLEKELLVQRNRLNKNQIKKRQY